MAIISGSALRVEGIPISEEITSGSEFSVELEQGPGYLTLESKRDGNGFYTSSPNFASISGSNLTSTIYGKHIISAVMGNTTSGSLSFIASRDIPANDIRVKVASPILNPKVNVGGGVDERFIITVKTDNAGTSATNQFTIPTSTSGITQAFNYDIETSDGQTITGVTGDTTITFPSAGTYDVKISGSFPYMRFANGGDRLKLLDIKNFGIYALGSTTQENAFRGCLNLAISATDIGYFENVTTFKRTWEGCSSLTSFPVIDTSSCASFDTAWGGCSNLISFPLLDTSSGTNFNLTWVGCSSLTSFPLIDTSSVSNFRYAFAGCSGLTSFPLIDTSSATAINAAWQNCSSLTSFPLIDTSNVTLFGRFGNEGAWGNCSSLTSFPLLDFSNGTDFSGGWFGCYSLTNFPANAFDTNIATNYTNAFQSTNLTTQSIDDILVSLDTSGVSNGTFTQSGGQAPSATGQTAIDNLVEKGWTITTTGGYQPPVYTDNLVASYSFDTDFSDYTGNNDLTAFGSATAGVTGGKVSDCAELDGNIDYTIAADSDDFSFTNGTSDLPFSISFWANFETYSSITNLGSWIISKRDDSTNVEYQVAFFDNKFQVWLFSQGGNSAYMGITSPFVPTTGGTTWQHFTVTYDGSNTPNGIKMYIDGISQTPTSFGLGTYLGMINGSHPVNIGSASWVPSNLEFNGKLDEFHIWKNRELTSAEVLEIYNTENAGNSILP